MRDVARRAGLSTGAVYRYFPGKEPLFEAMFEWGRPHEWAVMSTLLEGETPIEQLEAFAEKLTQLAAESSAQARQNFRGYGEAAEVPFLERELTHHTGLIIDVMERVVRDAQEAGDIDRELDPRTVAMLLAS